MSQHIATLLLGSNLGNTKKNIEMALELIEKCDCMILQKSKILLSEPVEFTSANIFSNIAIVVNTQSSPTCLLADLKKIEVLMGRQNDSHHTGAYMDRMIDIDIVTFDKLIFVSDKLQIPHRKHLYIRSFSKELLSDLRQQLI